MITQRFICDWKVIVFDLGKQITIWNIGYWEIEYNVYNMIND